MTKEAEFSKWAEQHDFELPWNPKDTEMRDAFYAGWDAKEKTMLRSMLESPVPDSPATCIWAEWPVKRARGAALAAIEKALKKVNYYELFDAVKSYAAAVAIWKPDDRQFIPMCSTWMNQERWTDDRDTWKRGTAHVSQFRTQR